MVTRVVLPAILLACAAMPAAAQQPLPYDIDNFFRVRGAEPPPTPEPEPAPRREIRREPISLLPERRSPRIAYNLDGLFYNRVPDYVALGYRLDGLTDYVPRYRDGREVTPLRYEFDGLLYGLRVSRMPSAVGSL